MAVTQDILQTYLSPTRVTLRLLADGRQEVRALIFVLLAGVLLFVAQSPFQAREAHINPEGPVEVRLYWSAIIWIFMMPLALYVLAALVWGISKLARRQITGYAVRFTLFWAVLASTPLALLVGMVAGFIGPGLELRIVGFIWCAVFAWFWVAGLIAADRTAS
ncbi:MAG: YIP1 family protein [Sulfitobacter sp.]